MKAYIHALLMLLLISVGITPAVAQMARLNHLSVNEGLSQQDIESGLQDSHHYMWFGSYDGLNCYDGYSFKNFRHDPANSHSIADNRITALLEAKEGLIVIGTEGSGLLLYDKATEKFSRLKTHDIKLSEWGSVRDIKQLDSTMLLVGCNNGSFLVEQETSEEYAVVRFNLPNNSIMSQAVTTARSILIGTQSGLYIGSVSQSSFRINQSLFKGQIIYDICLNRGGEIWVCHNNSLSLISSTFDKIEPVINLDDPIINISELGDSCIIVATPRRLFKYNKHTDIVVPLQTNNDVFFQQNIIKNILVDSENSIWVMSGNKGVAQIQLAPAKFETVNIERQNLFVKCLLKTRLNRLMIGSKDWGLLIQKSDGQFDHLFGTNFINFLFEDSQGTIWLDVENRIYTISGYAPYNIKELSSFKNYPPNLENLGISATEDDQGRIWIGFIEGLLCVSDYKTNPKFKYHKIKLSEYTHKEIVFTQLIYDKAHQCLWASTRESGLVMIPINGDHVGRYTKFNTKSSALGSNHVWSLMLQANHMLWIGTDVGLYKMPFNKQPFNVTPCSTDNRVRTRKIMAITADPHNNIWLNTSQGLLSFNEAENVVFEYNYSDGLLSNALSEGSLTDAAGTIYIGSTAGVNYFDNKSLQHDTQQARIGLTNLYVMGKKIDITDPGDRTCILSKTLLQTKHINLRHDQNNISMDVVPIHYGNPQKNAISYFLEGFDKTWTTTLSRSINYNNLLSGEYVLHIKASNSDNVWSSEEHILKITIQSPPWRSWWAYTVYLAVLTAIIGIFHRYNRNRRLLHETLETERLARKSEVELAESKLRFHTNIMHEIRTPLSLIYAPLQELISQDLALESSSQKKLDIVIRNVNYLMNTVNQFLDLRKAIYNKYPLHVGEHNISQVVSSIMTMFNHATNRRHINYDFVNEIECDNVWFDSDMLSKILINIISNAYKFTPDRGNIFIFLHQWEDNAVITVEDSGKGIAPEALDKVFEWFYQSKDTSEHSGTGIGLALVKQLITIHKGSVLLKSEVGKGTSITIILPITRASYNEHEIDIQSTQSNLLIPDIQITNPIEMRSSANERSDFKHLLFIEDNEELSEYMIDILSNSYNVTYYNTAEQGLEYALKNLPDIVITDVILGDMNGLEFANKLKTNMLTSHIPIIILSAKGLSEDILAGLSCGAEDYITKPFNPNMLLLKVKNLIKLSQKHTIFTLGDKELGRESAFESKFLEEIRDIILLEMSHPDFSIDFVCHHIGMSRMQLHRKMIGITGESASHYIRTTRFGEAKKLLETSDSNISEAMYFIGLSNLSSFTVTFQKEFGISPSDIIKNRKTKH